MPPSIRSFSLSLSFLGLAWAGDPHAAKQEAPKHEAPASSPVSEDVDPLNPELGVERPRVPVAKPAKAVPTPKAAPKPPQAAAGHGGGEIENPLVAKAQSEKFLMLLKEGNGRYAAGQAQKPRQDKARREEVAKGQHPMAAVVACADSRVPPETVFDQGLGDLFVVRNGGNVLEPSLIGSLEYAVEHLGVRLVVVLGHERCGAVDAACKKAEAPGHVGRLVEAIQPAVEAARRQGGDLLTHAVTTNVQRAVDEVKGSWPVLAPMAREGRLTVVGGVYDIDDGLVTFFP